MISGILCNLSIINKCIRYNKIFLLYSHKQNYDDDGVDYDKSRKDDIFYEGANERRRQQWRR